MATPAKNSPGKRSLCQKLILFDVAFNSSLVLVCKATILHDKYLY